MTLDPKMAADLRGMVREVLKEALGSRSGASNIKRTEQIRISNDAELQAFVKQLIEPATLEAVRSGRLAFALANGSNSSPQGNLVDGVITEQKLDQFAGAGILVLGPGAVLTPLARDRARKLGLKIERRR